MSTTWPRPETWSRWRSAASTALQPARAAIMSAIGNDGSVGGPSASPVVWAKPLIASTIVPNPGRSRYGPSWPQPEMRANTSRGFSADSASQPRPQPSKVPGRKFSTRTSAPRTSRLSSAWPAGCARFSVTERLPRAYTFHHSSPRSRSQVRSGSPPRGFSILTTSAPWSASTVASTPPAISREQSITRSPASAPLMVPRNDTPARERSGAAEARREVEHLARVGVGHEGVAEPVGAPHHDGEAARAGAVDVARAGALPARRRPRQAVGAEDEERDGVPAQAVDEGRRLAVEEPRERAAAQRHRAIAHEGQHGREVEPPLEPRPHAMAVAALDLERALRLEDPQVIADRLAHHRGRGGARRGDALVDDDRRADEEDERGGERGRRPGPAPERARRGGRRRQHALDARHEPGRCAALGQAVQRLGQRGLDRLLPIRLPRVRGPLCGSPSPSL